jgi:multiple antibiotic resistance protein
MAMMKDLLLELGTLFAIINPYGLAFVFLSRTIGLTERERATVARQVAIYAFFVLIVSGFAGTMILGFFGVSIPALRMAGGLVVAVAGWNLLHESPHGEAGKASTTGTLEEVRRQAFFPLTVPLTTGPGTIATAITLAANHETLEELALPQLRTVIVAAIVAATIYHAYARVARIARIVGVEGTSVIMRLSAFLLLCVGVQIMITGVSGVLVPLLTPR